MKKRLLSILLVLALLFSLAPAALAAGTSEINAANALYTMGLFQGTGTNKDGTPIYDLDSVANREQAVTMLVRLLGKENEALAGSWNTPFTDVSAWAQKYVGYAYANGLTNGQTSTTFGGSDKVSARDYITFVLRALGYSSDTDFSWATAWEKSDNLGITSGEYNASSVIDRGQMALISYNALGISRKNTNVTLLSSLVADGTVASSNVSIAGASGLLSSDKKVLTASQVYSKASPAVFFIAVYGSQSDYNSNNYSASGSGFFITPDGVAITCYHVIDDTAAAKITTVNGSTYQVTNVLYYDEARDIAVIRVSKSAVSGSSVSAFPYLDTALSSTISGGDTVYAIGSPLGLQNTISNGIVSNPARVDGGQTFIQTTAAISHGSSGGALLNEYGEAIGVTAASYTDGQSLNLAIPLDCIANIDTSKTGDSYASVQQKEHGASASVTGTGTAYASYPDVPDFGANLGVQLFSSYAGNGYYAYTYSASAVISAGLSSTYAQLYSSYLTSWGYKYMTSSETSDYTMLIYYRASSGRYVSFGVLKAAGSQYVVVMVHTE